MVTLANQDRLRCMSIQKVEIKYTNVFEVVKW